MSVPELYVGRSVKCSSCGEQFTAHPLSEARGAYTQAQHQAKEDQARREAAEAERRRIDVLTSVRDFISASDGQHYIDLEPESRDTMEATVEALLANGSSTWDDLESSVIKLATGIEGRTEFLTLSHQQRLEALLIQSVTATVELQRAIAEATSLIVTRLEGIRIGTTVSGAVAARALGQQLSDDFSQ